MSYRCRAFDLIRSVGVLENVLDKNRLTQPFSALFRGQPIILSRLSFRTTHSSCSPFTIFLSLVTALAWKLNPNNTHNRFKSKTRKKNTFFYCCKEKRTKNIIFFNKLKALKSSKVHKIEILKDKLNLN